jgi:hypothetical protein
VAQCESAIILTVYIAKEIQGEIKTGKSSRNIPVSTVINILRYTVINQNILLNKIVFLKYKTQYKIQKIFEILLKAQLFARFRV